MKILMIGQYRPQMEGPANVVHSLCTILVRENQLRVVTTEVPSYPKGLGQWQDGEVQVWQERLIFQNHFFMSQNLLLKLRRAFALRKEVDLYHAHGMYDATVGLFVRSKPLVITYHGLPIQEALVSGWIRPRSMKLLFYTILEGMVLRRADAVIVLNGHIRDWMINGQGIDPSKIFLVPNGVDVKKFIPNPESEGKIKRSSDKRTIIFVKRLSEQSGVRYLIQSMSAVKEQFPDVQLLLIGDGELADELRGMVEDLGLSGNVQFIGRVPNDQVPTYLNGADIYVLPSVPQGEAEETFSLSLIEALACGKAVIATSIGGSKEIIGSGKDIGVLVPPRDPEALAGAIIRFLEDPKMIAMFGENARKAVVSRFTWEGVAKETLEVYEHARSKCR